MIQSQNFAGKNGDCPLTAIRADRLLAARGLFPSRAKAQEAIIAGLVRANGSIVNKPSALLNEDAVLDAAAPYPWASRGGVKLAAALAAFAFDPRDRLCLDIGASTGGFTDVLLHYGARRVIAVDVGVGQLHSRLRTDSRVRSLEKKDARALTREDIGFPEMAEMIVCDASFISLSLVLPHVLSLSTPSASLVALIKPQFEAGRSAVKKGIVRDPNLHKNLCLRIATMVEGLGWRCLPIIPSPISGGDGNKEFLLGARRL